MLPILFLFASAAPSAAPPTTPAEKLVCKREPVTGSLARFRKICRTPSQWSGSADEASDEARRMQERGQINSCAPDVATCG
jgi:hypothetical protein